MSTTENSLPPDDMPVTPNSEPSQTDSVLKVPPRHQASTGEIAGNPEGSNEAPHSTISPRQARQRLNVPMPNMEVLAIDDALGIQTEIDKARDKFLDLVESLKTGRYLTDKIQGVEKHSGLGEPRAVIFHGDYKVIIMASMIVDLPKDLRGQDPYEVYHYLLTKRLGSEIDYVVKGIDRKAHRPAQHREKDIFQASGKDREVILKRNERKIVQVIHVVIGKRNYNRINDWNAGHDQNGNQSRKQIWNCFCVVFSPHGITTFRRSSGQQLPSAALPYFQRQPQETAPQSTLSGCCWCE